MSISPFKNGDNHVLSVSKVDDPLFLWSLFRLVARRLFKTIDHEPENKQHGREDQQRFQNRTDNFNDAVKHQGNGIPGHPGHQSGLGVNHNPEKKAKSQRDNRTKPCTEEKLQIPKHLPAPCFMNNMLMKFCIYYILNSIICQATII